ncbi:MAG: prepilin-type N-terminal cleavage/methylation domain-containing protein [Lachnospiraceae bacterium]|nr:prepilin-type N-terminal cleavage/methylation domain-containing protein [Lachnospiraceae bacterium]
MGAERQKTDELHRDSVRGREGGCLNSKRYGKDNGGYSLVELIIVIAIIALIISTVFYSVVMVFGANAKSCANNIQRAIADCKVTTMGKSSAYMELYRDTDQNVYTKMYVWDNGSGAYVPSEPQKVGTGRVYVAYTPKGGAETELLAGDTIEIRFDRASGGFAKSASSGDIYESLHVQAGSKNYEIVLTELTGKSEVNLLP